MRTSFVLFTIAAAAFLTGSNTFAAGSTISSPISIISDGAGQNVNHNLRTHDHDQAGDDEERAGFTSAKIDEMLRSETYRTKKIKELVRNKKTDTAVYNLLDIDSNPLYRRIFYEYQNYIKFFAPHLISK